MNLKPLSPLARWLKILLKIEIGITIPAMLADGYAWFEYSNLPATVDPYETFLLSDALNAIFAIAQVILAIIIAVMFLRWIYRANKNLHALSPIPMRFSPGWAVGWYFIPIAHLFKPYQAMKEIWNSAHRGVRIDVGVLRWWWFAWIASMFLGRVALKLALRADNAQGFATAAVADAFSDGIDIVLDVVALILITKVQKAYDENYVEQSVAPLAPGTTA